MNFQDIDERAEGYNKYASFIAAGINEVNKEVVCPEEDCDGGQVEQLRMGQDPDGFTEFVTCPGCQGDGKITLTICIDLDTGEYDGIHHFT